MATDLLNTTGIRNFYDAAIKRGFLRDYHFRVIRAGNWLNADDFLYMTTASLPGRTVTSIQVPYMGLNFQVPGTANYNQNAGWPVTFRCDETLNIRSKLETWSRAAFDDITSTGANIPDKGADNQITLVTLDGRGDAQKQITLIGAWPVDIGNASFKMDGNGTVVTINVTIAYQYWESVDLKQQVTPAQPADRVVSGPGLPGFR